MIKLLLLLFHFFKKINRVTTNSAHGQKIWILGSQIFLWWHLCLRGKDRLDKGWNFWEAACCFLTLHRS